MHTREIIKWGKKYIPNFIGVFPVNKLPTHLISPSSFIVNTDTHNLPGKHWLAVSYNKNKKIYVFDPFGLFYPYLLRHYLHKLPHRGTIYYNNNVMLQNIDETNCGWYCLAWLMAINALKFNENHTQQYGPLFY